MNILTSVAAIVDGDEADTAAIPADYRGLDRFKAREAVVAHFEEAGLMHEIEKLKIEQPFGDRSGVVIEPWLTDQWYVNDKELAKDAIKAVREGETRFVPTNWEKTYYNWMEDIQPWCISRQLWWGHRIPVWYGRTIEAIKGDLAAPLKPFAAETREEALKLAKDYYGDGVSVVFSVLDGACSDGLDEDGNVCRVELGQDTDVLDTWFSSGLWPFSTMGWPNQTEELDMFYPGAVLVTAFDIIFFWVCLLYTSPSPRDRG